MSIAKFLTIPNNARNCNSPILKNIRTVPPSKISSFAAVRSHDSCFFFMFDSHSLYGEYIYMRLSPAHVSMGQMCGRSGCELIPTFMTTLQVDFGKSVMVVVPNRKIQSSSYITGNGQRDSRIYFRHLNISDLSGKNITLV